MGLPPKFWNWVNEFSKGKGFEDKGSWKGETSEGSWRNSGTYLRWRSREEEESHIHQQRIVPTIGFHIFVYSSCKQTICKNNLYRNSNFGTGADIPETRKNHNFSKQIIMFIFFSLSLLVFLCYSCAVNFFKHRKKFLLC